MNYRLKYSMQRKRKLTIIGISVAVLIGLSIAAYLVWYFGFNQAEPTEPENSQEAIGNSDPDFLQEETDFSENRNEQTADSENTDEAQIEVKKKVTISKSANDPVVSKVTLTPGEDSADPHIQAGKSYIKTFHFVEAEDEFKLANQSDPVTIYYLAVLNAYQGKREEATRYFNQLIASDPQQIMAQNAQNILKAYQLFDTYQDGHSEFLDTLIAKEFLSCGEVEIAIAKLKFVTENYVDYSDAWMLLGSAYMVYGNYAKAVTTLTQVLPSQKPEVYYWLGLAYMYEGVNNKALAAFKQALNKNYQPLYKVHEKMGDVYLELEDFSASAEAYIKAISIPEAVTYLDLYVRPVWIYIDLLEEPQKALELSKKALEHNPTSAMAHNLVGWSYLSLAQEDSAKEFLIKATELDPTLSAAYLNLGNYYRSVSDYVRAKENYLKTVELDPDGAVGKRARTEYKLLLQKERAEKSQNEEES